MTAKSYCIRTPIAWFDEQLNSADGDKRETAA
jgi:hypothetical protein